LSIFMAKKNEKTVEIPKEPVQVSINKTLEINYMPYAMSVIVSRAMPEIDGFKPSHRKLLYTMYKMGLLSGARTKSANVVGATMKLNPHGDQAIYETLVRLSRGYEALLHPFIDSKGNFGKTYSRDMAYAASRYTEVKLDPFCAEIFSGIDSDAVDFTDNYDNTMKEPVLLPTTFPNILVSPNLGIAVGMASNICSFNLKEVCETTIALIKNPEHNLLSTLKGPDFSTGGELIYDKEALEKIYETGLGSVKLRAVWKHNQKQNCIEITEIPYTTTIEAIIDKVTEHIKSGKIREIADMRDETDKQGLKIAVDLKRGADPDRLMARLMKITPLSDSFSCNFNVLIEGTPHVMGVREILDEWVTWRTECIKRQIYFKLTKMRDRLHLLLGLQKILVDIDKAIRIIRNTEEDSEVIPNLMIGFGIDEAQAEFIAEIKLRNINKEYILSRTSETERLQKDIAEAEETLKSKAKVKDIIIKELTEVAKKYGVERKTKIVYADESDEAEDENIVEDYPVHYFLTREGYFKKVTPLSLRMSGEHKLKEGDEIVSELDGSNSDDLLFFTNKCQAYKVRSSEMPENKISILGIYLPSHLGMDEGEEVVGMAIASKGAYEGSVLFVYQDGKVARVSFSSYETKTYRRRLTNAFSSKSPPAAILQISEECEILLVSNAGKGLIFNTASLSPKPTRSTAGVKVMTLKAGQKVSSAFFAEGRITNNKSRYKTKTLPAAGAVLRANDMGQVQSELE
jgi:DNA gyrase subunit A